MRKRKVSKDHISLSRAQHQYFSRTASDQKVLTFTISRSHKLIIKKIISTSQHMHHKKSEIEQDKRKKQSSDQLNRHSFEEGTGCVCSADVVSDWLRLCLL